jgi:carboxyl-terminal processing protease
MMARFAAAVVAVALLGGVPAHADAPLDGGRILDEAWTRTRERLFSPALVGPGWDAAREAYRPWAAGADDAEAVSAAINAMLGELRLSHLGHYTPADPAYYQLLDIFRGAHERRIGELFPGGEVQYETVGVFAREIAGRVFLSGVLEGGPAHRAGLLRGDEIVAVAGAPFHPVRSFAGKAGQPLEFTVRRRADAEPFPVVVAPERVVPRAMFMQAMKASVRTIERDGVSVGYIHPWSYASSAYQRLLVEELSAGRLKDADALVLDLRDGWGGARIGYLDPFIPNAPSMQAIERDGERSFDGFRWRRPLVVLINEGTRSGKEILAHAVKRHGLGRLVGTRTQGAVLAAQAFLLSDDSLLLVPVNDVTVDGERLEGVGVAPDVHALRPLPYSQGADAPLDQAVGLAAEAARASGQ